MRIDSHHHLWRYTPHDYDWIDDSMHCLQRDFLPADLSQEIAAANVQATVAVQARQTLEETQWLLDLAAREETIRGVIGWAPIASDDFMATLHRLRKNSLLRGLRHVVQSEPAGFLDGKAFNRGIASLRNTDLVYDILIFAFQLAEATRFIDRHPGQTFVIDHIAKPDIIGDGFNLWNDAIRELARRDNVFCKISGMVTEARWDQWSPSLLHPYYETVLEAFGPSRLMIGSDWPVLTVACSYSRWWQVVSDWLAPLSSSERAQIEGDVATRVYRLNHNHLKERAI